MQTRDRLWIFSFIAIGALLRLVWPGEMKWQGDEVWMHNHAIAIAQGEEPFPLLGMRNGVGIYNPGMGVWAFIGLAKIQINPVAMVQWVQWSNIAAIVLFTGFILRCLPLVEQSIWLWGMAIASVNPLAIIFSRAIWAQDLLPLFCTVAVMGHWGRRKFWGSFVWGWVGGLLGQIHMSGFFWQAALVVMTLWPGGTKPRTNWRGFAIGSFLAYLTLIPWLQQVAAQSLTAKRPAWAELLTPNFHLHWLTGSWGLNMEYELSSELWHSFLAEPRLQSFPTYGVAIALVTLLGLCLFSLWKGFRQKTQPFSAMLYLKAGAIVMPILLFLAKVRIPAHYLIVLFPFPFIWVAWLNRGKSGYLVAIALCQLFLSATFLFYIHQHFGIIDGNYGLHYQFQHEIDLLNN